MDLMAENMQRITRNGEVNLQPQWSPDDNRLAFTSYMNGNPDLYIANLILDESLCLSARDGSTLVLHGTRTAKKLLLPSPPKETLIFIV